MLIVINKHFMLSIFKPNVVMLSVVAPFLPLSLDLKIFLRRFVNIHPEATVTQFNYIITSRFS
jgi:hypothetical protein